jgi:EAL and modified HD-GYP domain-containing signal transduction protein
MNSAHLEVDYRLVAGFQNTSVARQAIYDAELAVCGYELLYRSDPSARHLIGDTAMTASALTAAFTDIGLDTIVGDQPVWVNVGEAFMTRDLAAFLPPERTVIELLETGKAERRVVEALAQLRSEGYRIALDDFSFHAGLEPLVKLADVIKVDVLAHDEDGLEEQVRLLKPYDVTLLAEKVETYEMLERCQALGFVLFQGYFLSTPRTVSSAHVSTEAAVRVQLAARLNDPEASFSDLSEMIASDVTLSYRLLRYINSASVGLREPVVSLRDALVMLGSRRVRSWVTLLLLSDAGAGRPDLVTTALLRAHMCRSLAKATDQDSGRAFLVGLLSVADALVDRPLADVIKELPIGPDLVEALLAGEGQLGDLLGRVIAHERADFAAASAYPLDASTTTRAYIEAVDWSTRLVGSLAA